MRKLRLCFEKPFLVVCRFPIKNGLMAQYRPILASHWRFLLTVGQYWGLVGICRHIFQQYWRKLGLQNEIMLSFSLLGRKLGT